MFQKGNTKLGPGVWCWSVPAVKTCPGSTEACRSVCYATRGFFCMPTTQDLYTQNWRLSRKDSFIELAVKEIYEKGIRLLRVHVSGDFYDAEYVRRWRAIAKRCPQTHFYAYTRSWGDRQIQQALRTFAALGNVQLWYSFDRDMPVPPRTGDIKLAYMSSVDGDWPPAGSNPDLVFRVKTETVVKRDPATDTLVCPVENGVTKTTCTKCQLCFGKRIACKSVTTVRPSDQKSKRATRQRKLQGVS